MLATVFVYAAWLQEASTGWDIRSMWGNMGWLARIVVFILFLLSVYSFGVMIDRFLMYNNARKQSRLFVQQVAGARRATSPKLWQRVFPNSNPLPSRCLTRKSSKPPSAVSSAPSPSCTRK